MATTEKGMYHPYAHARGATVASFRITANATPTVTSDPGGVVSSVAKPPATTGIYVVTLKRRYSALHCVSETGTLLRATRITAITAGGSAANTVTITFCDLAGAPNDSAASIATVQLFAYDTP
jgi:hypothetical protein